MQKENLNRSKLKNRLSLKILLVIQLYTVIKYNFKHIFNCQFLDEPGKPGNLEVTDWDKNFVDLKWIPPKEDGGSPITGYLIEVKDKSGK